MNNSVHNIKAVGIPHISDDITEINLSNIAIQMNLSSDSLVRGHGPVDLLIGIDHAKMHTGETREVGNLIARLSPLGWVLFGAMSGEMSQITRVFHLRYSTPVDLTDFWTTEAMGVSINPCHCKADKLSETERKEQEIIESSCQKVNDQW